MMKRILACLIAVACLLTAFATFALAETMTMKVIKCKQAVNLRQGPTTDTPSLGLVPLGTEMTGCSPAEGTDKEGYKWYAVNYQGIAGYIREDFLQVVAVEGAAPAEEPAPVEAPAPAEEPAPAEQPAATEEPAPAEGGEAAAEEEVYVPWADRPLLIDAPIQSMADPQVNSDDFVILDTMAGDVHVMARQIFTATNEYLMVVGLDANGNELWRRETATDDVSEMTQTDAFMGGTAEMPLVLMYNDWEGLSAQDPATGETRWEVTKDQVFLGGSISRIATPNGIVYIAGYYGPDPVAIDANGNVLWQASSGEYGATWLYNMEQRDVGLACYYAMMSGDHSGVVVYDYNGQVVDVQYD